MEWIDVKSGKFPDFEVFVLLYLGADYFSVGYLTELRTMKNGEGTVTYALWNGEENYGNSRPTHWTSIPPKPTTI